MGMYTKQLRDLSKVTDEEIAALFEQDAAMQKAATRHATQTPAMRHAELSVVADLEDLFQSLYDSVTHCRSCGHRFTVNGGDKRWEDFDGLTTGRCYECEDEYVTDPENKWAAIL